MAISYKRDTDYQKKINQAAAIGDNTAAAVYEAQRNAKIQGEGLTGVSQTNRYADYLPDTSVVRSITRQEQSPGIAQTVQKTTTYQNPYQKELDRMVNDYTKSSFSYNQDTDPAAQAYRENYIQNGQLAMQDTMAQAAARTGGLASSYATQTGQQAYNSYMSDLNAQLAGLRQQAYENYLSDQALQQNRINTVASLGQQAESSYYNRVNDAMNRWATLGYADDTVAGILGVAAGTPTTDQSYRTWQQNFQQAQQDQAVADANRAYANDLAGQMLQLGLTPEEATLQTAGISAADAAALSDFYKQQLALAQTGGSGGGGSYGSGSGGGRAETDSGLQEQAQLVANKYTNMNGDGKYIVNDPNDWSILEQYYGSTGGNVGDNFVFEDNSALTPAARQIAESANSEEQKAVMIRRARELGTITENDMAILSDRYL
nr:MAG TPA: hypothetical protein [Bacteriophage sp.]